MSMDLHRFSWMLICNQLNIVNITGKWWPESELENNLLIKIPSLSHYRQVQNFAIRCQVQQKGLKSKSRITYYKSVYQ